MAKKRKNKKKNINSKKQANSFANISSEINEMKKLLRMGSVRKAAAIASTLVTRTDLTVEIVEQIVKTLKLRLNEMISNNQTSKAAEKLENILKHRPNWQPLFQQNFLLKLDLEGGSDFIIKNYETDLQSTKNVDDYIQNKLKDIRCLSMHKKLSDEHLLKKQAKLLLSAWEEIESESATAETFDLMRKTIGRKSPLVGWRLFVQALNFWYLNDDEKAVSFLKKAEVFKCVEHISQILRNLILKNEMTTDEDKIIERKMRADSKFNELYKLDKLLKKEVSAYTARKLVDFIKNPVYPDTPLLHEEMCSIAFEPYFNFDEFEDDHGICMAFNEIIEDKTVDLDEIIERNCIITNDYCDDDWKERLNEKKFSKLEKALVYLRMAEEKIKLIESSNNSFARAMSCFGSGVDDTYETEKAEDQKKVVDYLHSSIINYPLVETYRLFYKLSMELGHKDSMVIVKLLKLWVNDFPDDEAALLLLTKSYKEEKKYSQALKTLEKLKKVAPGNPEIFPLIYLLILDYATDLLFKGKNRKVVKILDNIPQKTPDYFKVVATVLRWFAVKSSPVKSIDAFAAIKKFKQPFSVEIICRLLKNKNPKFNPVDLQLLCQNSLEDDKIMVKNFLLFKNIECKEWNPFFFKFYDDGLLTNFKNGANSLEDVKNCLDLIVKNKGFDNYKLIWILTAKGLNFDVQTSGFFLACRAAVLDENEKRSRDCLAAAKFIAKKENDEFAFMYIKKVADFLYINPDNINGNISKDKFNDIINFEKKFDKHDDVQYKREVKRAKKKVKKVKKEVKEVKEKTFQPELF